MKTDWDIFEKIMSIIQLIFGIAIIWIVIKTVKYYLVEIFGSADLNWESLLQINILEKTYFSFIHGLIGVLGGTLWFKNKKSGWMLSLSFWIITCCTVTLTTAKSMYRDSFSNIIKSNEEYWIYSIVIFISLLLIFVLSSKYFREKYKPDLKTLTIYGSILALLLITRFILFLST
ncbi:MAG: hypothetical protein MK202_08560 [Tenacibaculum sp.]|nr:hypothetical protein [Tenacibaculum sp.]